MIHDPGACAEEVRHTRPFCFLRAGGDGWVWGWCFSSGAVEVLVWLPMGQRGVAGAGLFHVKQ
ncbi:protein of unknown function [Pararobbsia alpina]